MQSEGICHYDLIANATSKPAYEDMIVGSVTPQMVIFITLTCNLTLNERENFFLQFWPWKMFLNIKNAQNISGIEIDKFLSLLS